MGGWSDIETVQNFYLKNTNDNEKRAVDVLDKLMVGKIVQYPFSFDRKVGVNAHN